MKNINAVPPIRIWLYSIIILILFFGFIRFQHYRHPAENNIYNIKTKQIISHTQKYATKDYYKVVVIGSSITESYLLNFNYFFSKQNIDTNFKLCLYKIIVRSGNPKSFCNETQILSLLLQHPPDLLLIEDNIVCYSNKNKMKAYDLIKMKEFYSIFQLRNKLLHRNDSIPFYFTQKNQDVLSITDKELNAKIEKYYGKKIRTQTQNKIFDSLLTCFSKKNCAVKILLYPRPLLVNKYITDNLQEQKSILLQSYKSQYNIETLQTGDNMDNTLFCDYLHANKNGQETFSAHLYEILKKHFQKTTSQ